ncbi:MAG: DNA polymerase III subunit gamma/tau [Spirochaetota bacterium]
MNYEVTATRKRPRTFDGLVGQEFVVASLKNNLKSGRIANAYLFAGPRGVGKTSAARILARALNCPDGPASDGCEEYPGSDEIARGTAIDVIEIDGASNTSVNDVRQIKDEILFAPTNSPYKIYIIDEVHMLSNSAFNALLKTIEEPPPYIVFIFATTELHKVPATIRSRCQQFNFRLIPLDEIKAKLAHVAAEMGVGADDEALFWIAKESTGSLRDAYTLFDQVISFTGDHITLDKITEKLGLVGIDHLNEIADAVANGDGQKLIEITEAVLSLGISVEQFTIDLAEYFRGILFLRKGIRKESILGMSPDRFSGRILKSLTDTQVEHALELALGLYRAIRYSLNQRFDLELMLSKLSSLRDYLTPREILQGMQELRESLVASEQPSVPPRSEHHESESEQPAEPGERIAASAYGEPDDDSGAPEVAHSSLAGLDHDQVTAIIQRVRPARLALSTALERALRWEMADAELRIIFGSEYPANAARGEEEVIRNAAADVLGKPTLVRIKVDTALSAREPAPTDGPSDENVEMVKRVFRGEIVEEEQ